MVSRMRELMGVYGARLSVTQLHDVLEWWHAFSVVKRSRRLREVRILEATHCYTGQLRWMYCQWLADSRADGCILPLCNIGSGSEIELAVVWREMQLAGGCVSGSNASGCGCMSAGSVAVGSC